MKRPLSLLAMLLACTGIFAQNAQKRLEFDLDDWFDDEIVYPFGEHGFVLSSYGDKPRQGQREWKYDLYDTDLSKAKSIVEKIPEPYGPPVRYSTKDELLSFYHKKNGQFLLQSIRVDDALSVTSVGGKIRGRVRVKEIIATKDYVYLNTSVHKRPHLFVIDRKTGTNRMIPIKVKGMKDVLLTHMEVREETGGAYVYVQADQDRKVQTFVMRFGPDGKQEDMLHIKGQKKQIKYATGYSISDSSCIFMGTYSNRFSAPAEGIYVCKTSDDKISYIRFHSFTSLKNFFVYLSERLQAKVERKKEKKKKKGKELTYRYYIASHEVVPVTDGFLYLGESYYPTYRTETYVTGNGVTQTRTVFDGYQYTHAFVAKFSPDGELLWDQAFHMWPWYKPMRVRLFVSIAELTDESFTMAFSNGSHIISKKIGLDGQTISNFQSDAIQTNEGNDKIRYSFSDVAYWYDHHFLAYGRQTIKNPDAPKGEKKRKVFFVNKVSY